MTEQEWLTSKKPKLVLWQLGAVDEMWRETAPVPLPCASDRKLRLFACACYFRVCHVLPNLIAHDMVRTAEQFADGTATVFEFMAARTRVRELLNALEPRRGIVRGAARIAFSQEHALLALADYVCSQDARTAAWQSWAHLGLAVPYITAPGLDRGTQSQAFGEAQKSEEPAQSDLLRDIFGNPFRPVAFDAEWRSDTALSLAKHIYEARDFAQMPILADALQDAGCDNADILNHCRDANQVHVRGCWVVDHLLEKG